MASSRAQTTAARERADVRSAATLRRAVMLLSRRLQAERATDGLSLTKISIMGHLARRGELTPTELAAADRLQPQSLTRVLAELERDGRVVRARGTVDRRQRVFRLTAAGEADLTADMRQRDEWLAKTMADELSPTERDLVLLAAGLIERLGAVDGRPGFARRDTNSG